MPLIIYLKLLWMFFLRLMLILIWLLIDILEKCEKVTKNFFLLLPACLLACLLAWGNQSAQLYPEKGGVLIRGGALITQNTVVIHQRRVFGVIFARRWRHNVRTNSIFIWPVLRNFEDRWLLDYLAAIHFHLFASCCSLSRSHRSLASSSLRRSPVFFAHSLASKLIG